MVGVPLNDSATGVVELSTASGASVAGKDCVVSVEGRPARELRRVRKVADNLVVARKSWRRATEQAAKLANELYDAGWSEVDLARELGVDRARTLRRWLGTPRERPQ